MILIICKNKKIYGSKELLFTLFNKKKKPFVLQMAFISFIFFARM